LAAALTVVATSLTLAGAHATLPAAADTPVTFLNEQFSEATFPPTSWSTPSGTWSASCPATTPATGCSARAMVSGGTAVGNELLFNPTTGIPSNLQNVTLSFYSDFSPDATTSGDSVAVQQASVHGDTGDFNQLVSIAGTGGSDATGTPVLHTVALPNDNLPLAFRWTSFGDTSTTSTSTWDISNVMITGTAPATSYTLTANPISNTVYPHIVAGAPVTIALSGSSNPTGDALQFSIASQPKLGTLGAITQVDATDATVVYSPPADACPDPNGTPGFLCSDPFTFTVHDVEGNVSSPAQVDLDVLPGGAGGVLPVVTAPASESYTTLSQNGNLVQAADLSSAVSVGPSNFPDEIQLDLQASTGTIELLNATASGVTFLNGTASGDQTIDMAGSLTKLNQALGEFLYFPPSGSTPTATINMFPEDMGPTGSGPFAQGAEVTTTINGIVTNPPPSLALPTGALSIANDAGPLTFPGGAATGFFLTDAGASSTTQDEVLLGVSAGSLALPASDTSGPNQLVTVQSLGNGSSYDITGTVAHIDEALPDLTFDPALLPSETVTLSASAVDPDTGLAALQQSISIKVIEAPFPFGATSFGTLENAPATVWLCGGGPPNDALNFSITTDPGHGTLVADPSASPASSGCSPTTNAEAFVYTPSANYTGPDSFIYSITDPTTGLDSTNNTVTITVSPHLKPTAYDVSAFTTEDVPVTAVLCGENPEPSITPTLTFSIVSNPSFGTLTDAGPASVNTCNQGNVAEDFTYTPNAGTFTADGTDTFAYVVSNGTVSDPATGTISVATLTPQVIGYPATVNEDSSIGLNLCSTAPNGSPTFSIVDGPAHGTLDQTVAPGNGPTCPTGYFAFGYERYVPTPLYSGPDLIGYTATAGGRTSTVALITLTVAKVEIPPTASAQTVTDIAPQPVAVILSGTSLQGSTLTYRVTSNPSHGTLSGTAPDLTYTPSIGNGTDSFTFVANDGVADSPPATVTIDVTTPRLSSSVCYTGTPINLGLGTYNCAGPLTSVSDPVLGAIELAHTSGAPNAELQLQQTITNDSLASDTVTLTAPSGTSQWQFLYDVDGGDQTAQLTGSGLTVTLGPAGTSAASIDVQIVVFAPLSLPAPAVVSAHVLAVSGNDPSVYTQVPIEVQDGTSVPTLTLAQANGSGGVSFPTSLLVSPPLFGGGPSGSVDIEAGLQGTGINTFAIHAEPAPNNTAAVTPAFFLGTTNVTAAVLAGTEVITCYAAPVGCPPMHAVLTPPASGSGFFDMEIVISSTIDGQGTQDFAGITLAGTVGPDFSTSLPNLGVGVYEATPLTQTLSQPTELSGSTTRTVHLHNDGDVSDTFTVQAAVTLASGDTSSINFGATAPGFINLGPASDVTRSITGTGYNVTIPAGDYVDFQITDAAASSTAAAPPQVVLTATSQLDPVKVDSFEVTFPTYSYRPDAVLTGPDGSPIGAGVYQQSYPGPVGNSQQAEYDIDQSRSDTIDITLADRGTGHWPPNATDTVVVTSPSVDPNFNVTYALLQNGTSTDVTAAITGSGLTLNLGQTGSGAPTPVIAMTASASVTSQPGHPGYYPLTVTSLSSLPAGLADVVVAGLYNTGQSQLRFAGLPQPEPSDITATVQQDHDTNRVAPFPDAGYAAGATYGAYSDPTGQKFAYVSAYDTFDLQVASEIVTHTQYRIQMVDPGDQLRGLPAWERDALGLPYYSPNPEEPADPLAAGSGLNPTIMAGGVNITAAVENGTYTTASLGTNETTNITVSFAPTSQLRYIPLKFNLINAATGEVEDVMVIQPSSIVSCTPDGSGEVQQTITTSTGSHKLNFEAWDRTDPQSPTACLQHLSHSWITSAPLVLGQYVPGTSDSLAGGDNPVGLWFVPQPNTILRVNTDNGFVTGNATAFVDSPLTDGNGNPDANTASDGLENYYFLGAFPNLNWSTTDTTNGLPIAAGSTLLPAAPFPLVQPSVTNWPNNSMYAQRYFQVDGMTGAPAMVGEMDVHVPWFSGNVPLTMEVDSTRGLVLNYPAPAEATATLPMTDGSTNWNFYNFYWNVTSAGAVTQGGCLGIPSALFVYLGYKAGVDVSGGPNLCLLGATVTFEPISPTPGAEARVSQVTVSLLNPGIGAKASPEFNLNSFSGEIDFDPTTEEVTKVVLDPDFGVGPPTGCQEDQNLGIIDDAQGLTKALLFFGYLPCPTNYFFFNARLTYQTGGFDTGYATPGGIGLQFKGTLTFLNVINLQSIEADISTDPFNFHFADSPIDFSISNSIPVSANLTFSGDVGANGFDINVSGGLVVDGVTIAGASGVLSTLGIGVCGTLVGVSMGFGYPWGSSPQIYPSGCTTNQYNVGA
jgi:hypothetical protein